METWVAPYCIQVDHYSTWKIQQNKSLYTETCILNILVKYNVLWGESELISQGIISTDYGTSTVYESPAGTGKQY